MNTEHVYLFQQGSKGERGPIGIPGPQGLTGTKGDQVCDQFMHEK